MIHAEKILKTKIAELRLAISDQNLELLPDYEQRVGVLRELKFIDENSTVLLKGRVACEVRFLPSPVARLSLAKLTSFSPSSRQINSANELILTELILENILADFEPEEIVALLSCFVFQEKTDIEPEIPSRLKEVRRVFHLLHDLRFFSLITFFFSSIREKPSSSTLQRRSVVCKIGGRSLTTISPSP